MKRRVLGAVALSLCASILMTFAACSGSSGSAPQQNAAQTEIAAGTAQQAVQDGGQAADKSTTAAAGAASQPAAASSPEAGAAAALSSQKIIERLSYQIESTQFDSSVSRINALCTQLGGYMQTSSIGGVGLRTQGSMRSASFTLRIPQEKLAQFKGSAGSIGNVLNYSSSSENISEQYYDTEARLKSLRTEQERLLDLMKKSGSLTDLVALEKALADVNYQIEQLTGTLRQYDSLISFSTVSIQLNEVVKQTELEKEPVTLWGRIAQQFRSSLRALGSFGEGLLVFLLGGAPILLLLAAVLAAIILLVRFRRKRLAAKLEKPAAPPPAPPAEQPEQKEGEDRRE